MMERTFVIIKPDAVQRGKIGKIIQRFEDKGLKIVALKMLTISKEQAERQYSCHKGKPFYPTLVSFMTSGPAVALCIEAKNAISIVRKMLGATDPINSEPGTIRGDFSVDTKHNLVHASDSKESVELEEAIYFPKSEIQGYHFSLNEWFYSEKP
ncbi:MAG: nucleoside-diphosphate kinase [Candidatus Riflebacteria bacterium]|nr:nucleoside-diphosphate kinase [Candidatus Riflebacteria bacterium]